MTSSRSLTANPWPLQEFRSRATRVSPGGHGTITPEIDVHLFEWTENTAKGCERSGLRSAKELDAQNEGTVRVTFAPPTAETTEGLAELFEKCGIPSAFIEESLQGVSQSFAAQEDVDGTMFIWFHFLCKTFTPTNNPPEQMQGLRETKNHNKKLKCEAQSQSQEDFTWMKTGCVLKITKQQVTPSQGPTRTQSSNSEDTLVMTSKWPNVDLFCFGAPSTLYSRFQALTTMATHDDLQEDPYFLLDIVFEELYRVMDHTGWAIAEIFGSVEKQTLDMASKPGKATTELPSHHFTGLHNLAKHTIYLRENCEAALTTLDDLRDHHKTTFVGDSPSISQKLTCQALKYQKTLFQSTQRRLSSLDARMENIIQLSFHIVTQGDSRLMQSENQSMKTIAVMTLIFMPLNTVAAIFGSEFMALQDDEQRRIIVSKDFWLLWIIAIPLTIFVMAIWWTCYMDAKGRLIGGMEPRRKRESGYMGWKTSVQTSRRTNDKSSV